jgi:hypothetical protein
MQYDANERALITASTATSIYLFDEETRTMIFMKAWRLTLVRSMALFAAAGCGSSTESSRDTIASIDLFYGNPPAQSVTLFKGGGVTLTVVARDAAGEIVPTDTPFTLVSRNPQVVTIDAAGRVTPINAGSTYVVATLVSNGRTLSDSMDIGVAAP